MTTSRERFEKHVLLYMQPSTEIKWEAGGVPFLVTIFRPKRSLAMRWQDWQAAEAAMREVCAGRCRAKAESAFGMPDGQDDTWYDACEACATACEGE